MIEANDPERGEETEDTGFSQDDPAGGIGGQGGEGEGAADATPELGDEGEEGQTETPAPDDAAGEEE
jgi:hypothetical protein